MTSAMIAFPCLGQGKTAGGPDGDPAAENAAASATGNWEMGFHLGTLLPNQVSGVSEIMGLGGVRGGMRLGPNGWLEAGFISGNGDGQQWKNIVTNLRMDVPVENLVGIAMVGFDVVQSKGPDEGGNINFGGHVGAGIQAVMGTNVWLRTDMKFGFSPGTSLYVGFGMTYRFVDDGPGGGTPK